MTKKKLNLIQLIAAVFLLIYLSTANYMTLGYDQTFLWAKDVDIHLGTYTYNEFALTLASIGSPLPASLLVLIVIYTIMCAASVFSKSEQKDGVIHSVIPVIMLLFGLWFFTSVMAPTGYEDVVFSAFPIVSCGAVAITTVLAFMKRSNFVFPNTKNPPVINETKVALSQADELNKYKELLDKGVITQEEFDAKKKQLLGL